MIAESREIFTRDVW